MCRTKPSGHPGVWLRTLSLSVLVALAGCDDLLGSDSAEHFAKAEEAFEQAKFKESLIQLKTVIQEEPKNSEARGLLGRVYFELHDHRSAEKELLRARDLGAKKAEYVKWLGETWLRMDEPDKILENMNAGGRGDNATAETVQVLRAKAQIRKAELQQNPENLELARAELKQIPAEGADNAQAQAALGRIEFLLGNHSVAEKHSVKALELTPNDIDALLLSGDLQLVRKKNDVAVERFQAALDQRPHDPVLKRALAWSLVAAGRSDEALTTVDELLAIVPTDASVNYMKSLIAWQREDFETALFHAREALNAGRHLQSVFIAGAASYGLGQLELAYDYMQGFLTEVPSHVTARKILAATALKLGRVAAAVETLQEVRADSPNDAVLFAAVADAALQSGYTSQGQVFLKQAQDSSERTSPNLVRLGLAALRGGDVDQAIEDLKAAVDLDNGNIEAHSYLITAYLRAGDPANAMEAVARMKRDLPNDASGLLFEGIVVGLTDDLLASRANFERVLEMEPGHPSASANLAALALLEGDQEEARKLFDDVLALQPDHVGTHMHYSNLEIAVGDVDAAIDHLRKALAVQPDHIDASVTLGGLLLDRNTPVEALAAIEPAIAAHPEDPGLLLVSGKALIQMRQLSRAVDNLERLRSLRPELTIPELYLAQAYELAGDLRQALRAITRATTADPENQGFKFEKARLEARRGNLDEANLLIAQLKKTNPEDPALAELEASVAIAQNEPELAIERFRVALDSRETNFLNLQLAMAQVLAGRPDEALESLATWLTRYPDDWLTRAWLAGTYLKQGQHGEARKHYQELIRLRPDYASAHNNVAWLSLQMDDLQIALKHGEEARRLRPDSPTVADTLGMVYFALGREDEAKDLLFAARQADPDNPTIATHLAQILVKQGRTEQAADLLRGALRLEESFNDRQIAEDLLNQIGG